MEINQKIFNSISKVKENFKPLEKNKVKMYVCGMTVYDFAHVGHARVMVVFDTISRWFRAAGYEVTYVRNITDIDDKIIKRANEQGIPLSSLTERFISAMDEDSKALGVIRPDLEPRATEHIKEILTLINTLISKGFAYVANNGDVFYRISAFPAYGKLSGKNLKAHIIGDRISDEELLVKENPEDFVLWKAAKHGEPFWESPWGNGRPGWHIECSAMSSHHLGNQFDIHGGGQDLIFPHHENEIAQSEAAHGGHMANYWVHNGFVQVDNEKMAKSTGNFFTIRDVIAKYNPEVIRFFILRAHYRSPLNYSEVQLNDAKAALSRLYTAVSTISKEALIASEIDWSDKRAIKFKEAMEDDFNTAEAISVLFEIASEANSSKSTNSSLLLINLANLIGLLNQNPSFFFQGHSEDIARIEHKIAERAKFKNIKDYKRADSIRDELKLEGIILEDLPDKTTWKII